MGVDQLTTAGLLLGLLALGTASGLVPVINAEAIVTATVLTRPALWLPASVSITIGQCTAKTLIYLTARGWPARRGRDGMAVCLLARVREVVARHRRSSTGEPLTRHPRRERALALLGAPLPGTCVVLLSATLGVPPLAVVSVLAGIARLRLPLFVGACLVGRLVRFVAIAWPVAHVVATAR